MFEKVNNFLDKSRIKGMVYLLLVSLLMTGSYASYNYVTDPVQVSIHVGVKASIFEVIGSMPDNNGHYLVAIVEHPIDDVNRVNNKAYSVTCVNSPKRNFVALPYDSFVNISNNGNLAIDYVFKNDEVCNSLNKSVPLVKKGIYKI